MSIFTKYFPQLQADEVRLQAQANENDDNLKLDEILAMCAEYEEQIAQEIEDKRTNSVSKLSVSTPRSSSLSLKASNHSDCSNTPVPNSNGHVQKGDPMSNVMSTDVGNQIQKQTPNSPTTPTSVHHYNRYAISSNLDFTRSRGWFGLSVSIHLTRISKLQIQRDVEIFLTFV